MDGCTGTAPATCVTVGGDGKARRVTCWLPRSSGASSMAAVRCRRLLAMIADSALPGSFPSSCCFAMQHREAAWSSVHHFWHGRQNGHQSSDDHSFSVIHGFSSTTACHAALTVRILPFCSSHGRCKNAAAAAGSIGAGTSM